MEFIEEFGCVGYTAPDFDVAVGEHGVEVSKQDTSGDVPLIVNLADVIATRELDGAKFSGDRASEEDRVDGPTDAGAIEDDFGVVEECGMSNEVADIVGYSGVVGFERDALDVADVEAVFVDPLPVGRVVFAVLKDRVFEDNHGRVVPFVAEVETEFVSWRFDEVGHRRRFQPSAFSAQREEAHSRSRYLN